MQTSPQSHARGGAQPSFFGDQALRHHLHPVGWVAVGWFVALGLAVLVILWPRRDWEFNLSPAEFISIYAEPVDGEPLDLRWSTPSWRRVPRP